MEDLLYHEELYWRQRAKSFWLTEGDTNSKVFHAAATKRRKVNTINHLLDENGTRIDSIEDIGQMAVEYFKEIFTGNTNVDVQEEEAVRIIVTEEQNIKLVSELKFEEFSTAVNQMHPNKSAGPDGFSHVFFQHFWELLGREIFKCCNDWLKDLSFPVSLNDATLVLIPKKIMMRNSLISGLLHCAMLCTRF